MPKISPWTARVSLRTGRCAKTDRRPGVYSGAMPASAARSAEWMTGLAAVDPPEDCRPQVPVIPPP